MDERPKEADVKVEPTREYYPGAAWNFQEIGRRPLRRRKVSLEVMEQRKVSSKAEDDAKSVLDWEMVTLAVGDKWKD